MGRWNVFSWSIDRNNFGTYIIFKKNKIQKFFFLDIIACVSPIGIFLGRIANFINGELVGKTTNVYWSVIFPKIDMIAKTSFSII